MKKSNAFLSTLICVSLASSTALLSSTSAQARPRADVDSEIADENSTMQPPTTQQNSDPSPTAATVQLSATPTSAPKTRVGVTKLNAVESAKRLSESDALALWKSSLSLASRGKLNAAVDGLQALLDSDQKTVGEDLILITVARLFYDHGQFEKSIEYFNKVSRQSDFWLDSIQERSWANIRLNKLDEAQSGLTTLMVKSLAPQVGPEAFFEKAYLSLRRCDFASAFTTIDTFSDEFQSRSHRMSDIVENPHDPITEAFLVRLAKEKVSMIALGKSARDIPRLAQRDQLLIKFARGGNMTAAYKRLGELAQRDLEEIHTILRKMLVVQTETIEYMNLQESDKGAKLHHASLERNQIRFPVEPSNKEVWLDELDHYHAQSAGCANKKGG